MASIYKSATRVVVWLGPYSRQLSTGLKALSGLSSVVEVDFEQSSMTPVTGQDLTWADLDTGLPCHGKARSAIMLCSRCRGLRGCGYGKKYMQNQRPPS